MNYPIRSGSLLAASLFLALANSVAQEATQGPALEATAQVRPTSNPGWFVLVREPVEYAGRLRELGQLRVSLNASDLPAARGQAQVTFDQRLTTLQRDAKDATSAARSAARNLGLEPRESTWLPPGFVVADLDEGARAALLGRADVLDVQPIYWQLPQIGTAVDANHHDAVGAHALTVGGVPITGHGVEIAVLDSGLDMDMNGVGRPHKAFFENGDPLDLSGGGIAGSRVLTNFLAGTSYFPKPTTEDIHGHGTRVASTIAAAKWSNGIDVANSVAYSAKLHNYKISDDNYPGAPASTIVMLEAIQEALTHPAIRVANLSYDGDPAPGYFLNLGIDQATNAGLFVTLSAGNFGSDLTFAHGAFNAMVVGGSYEFSPFPYFTSAIGPLDPTGTQPRRYPDLIANGDQISTAKLDAETKYTVATGTSLAAGFVSGAAGLLFQAQPSLTPSAVKALLLEHTWNLAGGDPAAGGLGYLRIKEAVLAALAGDFRTGQIANAGSVKYLVNLTAGQSATYTLVWERVSPSPDETTGQFDFDLEVFDPNGQLVASSATDFDVEEKLTFTPAVTGTFTVVIREPNPLPSTVTRDYTLAGPGLVCSAAGLEVVSISPAVTPAVVEPGALNMVTFGGCELDTVTSVSIGGTQVPFAIHGPDELTFAFPMLPAFGMVPVDLQSGSLTTAVLIEVGAADGLLFGPALSSAFAPSTLTYASQPGDVHFLLTSLDLVESTLPSLFSLAIGNGFTSLVQIKTLVVPAGQAFGTLTYQAPLWGFGKTFYLQTIILDPADLTPPFATSTVFMTTVL